MPSAPTPTRTAPPPLTEKQWQQRVRDLCRVLGYRIYHTHTSVFSEAGFPDCVIAGHGRVLFRELKTARGRMTPEQTAWIADLRAAGADADVWRFPEDWDRAQAELSPRR